jgi:hypothetical protein
MSVFLLTLLCLLLSTRVHSYLVVSEIMFNPDGASPQPHQWIELKNVGSEAFDFAGVSFVSGIRISLHDQYPLEPGHFLVIAKSPASFLQKYGFASSNTVGFDRILSTNSDVIELFRGRNRLLKFRYGGEAPWPVMPNGFGFSLTLRDPTNASSIPLMSYPVAWRASAYRGGSPGFDDPSPPWASVAPLLVSEVFPHTDLPQVDAVEIYNPTDVRVNLTGYAITDQPEPPTWQRFRFPLVVNDTVLTLDNRTIVVPGRTVSFIEPNERITITEDELRFRLSSLGEQVYILCAEAPDFTKPTGYSDGVVYPAIDNGRAHVRRNNSIGVSVWVRAEWSPDKNDAGRLLSPAVIGSILYRPPSQFNGVENYALEYIEVRNNQDQDIQLWDEGFRGVSYYNTWRIVADDVLGPIYVFPRNITLRANASLLVVSVEPSVFRDAANLYDESVQVFGPWTGAALRNDRLRVQLLFPDKQNADYTVPYVVADELEYSSEYPWPRLTVATAGKPLVRINASYIGNEPNNWRFAVEGDRVFDNDASLTRSVNAIIVFLLIVEKLL